MWKKWKESEFFRKMKQVRVNRAIYLSAVVILLALAVVLAITAATNRAKKNPTDELPTDTTLTDPTPTPDHNGGNNEETKPTVNDSVPELALPVSGKLTKHHSVDVQVFSQTLQEYRVHLGIDISTAAGADVCSAADGTVAQIWEDPMMGWSIAVSHAGDCVTVYKNLSSTLPEGISEGTSVRSGQLIATVGNSAMVEVADDPHLHFEMTVSDLAVDPLEYFDEDSLKAITKE